MGSSSFANRLRRRSSTARSTGRFPAASSASGAHDGSVEGRQNRKFIQALTLLEFLAGLPRPDRRDLPRPVQPAHRWFYVPEMRADEAVLIKCYDSAEDSTARFTAHSAFEDPTAPADVLPRESIEVRTLVFHNA